MNKKIVIILMFLLLVNNLIAQINENLIVKSHVFNDAVAIRWAPKNLALLKQWAKSGYNIERQLISKNDLPVNTAENFLLGGKSILPINKNEMIKLAEQKPSLNLIYYALFEDSMTKSNDVKSLLNNLELVNNTYVFTMLAMQNDFELALQSGLGIIDKSVQKNETYLYKLYPNDGGLLDTIIFYIDMNEETILPIINEFKIHNNFNTIELKWSTLNLSEKYFGYLIEKSEDYGKNFKPLNEFPILQNNELYAKTKGMAYSDTINLYYKPIIYRIQGSSYLGIKSNVFTYDTAIFLPETTKYPQFVEVDIPFINTVNINWKFLNEDESLIKGFHVFCSDSAEGEFVKLDSNIIDKKLRNYNYYFSKPIQYIRIAAITLNNNYRFSYPIMVQQVDSFAPKIPTIENGKADTFGLVKINWKKNNENDLLGYKLYFSNSIKNEFTLLNPNYLIDTFYLDTIQNDLIRDSIYYVISAIDKRFNESKQSKILSVYVPNNIPPAPAVLWQVLATDSQVVLNWHKSSSNDILNYKLLKVNRLGNEQTYYLPDTQSNYIDKNIEPNETYEYQIIAIDKDNYFSKTSNKFTVKIPEIKIMPMVNIKYVSNDTIKKVIIINWDYPFDADVSHYRIIEKLENGEIKTLGTSVQGKNYLKFQYFKPIQKTNYMIIAYFKNGRRSKI